MISEPLQRYTESWVHRNHSLPSVSIETLHLKCLCFVSGSISIKECLIKKKTQKNPTTLETASVQSFSRLLPVHFPWKPRILMMMILFVSPPSIMTGILNCLYPWGTPVTEKVCLCWIRGTSARPITFRFHARSSSGIQVLRASTTKTSFPPNPTPLSPSYRKETDLPGS